MKITEAVNKIKAAGKQNTRIAPMTGSDKYKIEVNIGQGWAIVVKDVTRQMAEDIIRQADNKVILG